MEHFLNTPSLLALSPADTTTLTPDGQRQQKYLKIWRNSFRALQPSGVCLILKGSQLSQLTGVPGLCVGSTWLPQSGFYQQHWVCCSLCGSRSVSSNSYRMVSGPAGCVHHHPEEPLAPTRSHHSTCTSPVLGPPQLHLGVPASVGWGWDRVPVSCHH